MRNRTENQIELVWIRHGMTKSNKEHKYLGKTDEPLWGEGEKELLRYERQRSYPAVDYLFSGPMKRCMQTAKILYPEVKPVCIEEWTEMDFGEFEGKNYAELKDDERYRRWMASGGLLPFPGGESREEFILRCEKGFWRMGKIIRETIARERADREPKLETAGMIVHGGTIMALLSRYGGGDYFDYQIPNGKGYRCICKGLEAAPEFLQIRGI